MSSPEFDEVARDYSRHMDKTLRLIGGDSPYYADYKAAICQRFGLWSPAKRGDILEFGCGIGRNLTSLATRFPAARLSGYDISSVSVELAKISNPQVDFSSGSFPPPGGSGKFDLIFIAGVFHHIATNLRADVVAGLRSALRPSGRIIVFEPNPFNPVTRHLVNTCPFDKDAELLTRRSLVTLLTGNGLVHLASRYCLYFPPSLRLISCAERLLQFLPLGGQYFAIFTKQSS
jgi:SAM-dependent methyltransferase